MAADESTAVDLTAGGLTAGGLTAGGLTAGGVLAARWREVGDKVVQLAEAVPDAAYDVRPVPDVRSFADQLRHVAFWNGYVRDALRGGAADGEADELPRAAYPDKAAVVGVLRASFGEVRDAVAERRAVDAPTLETLVSFLEHAGEHYGQLAVYARLARVVPPASRPNASGPNASGPNAARPDVAAGEA